MSLFHSTPPREIVSTWSLYSMGGGQDQFMGHGLHLLQRRPLSRAWRSLDAVLVRAGYVSERLGLTNLHQAIKWEASNSLVACYAYTSNAEELVFICINYVCHPSIGTSEVSEGLDLTNLYQVLRGSNSVVTCYPPRTLV